MNESMDRALVDWLREGPESGPREGLERALAAKRRGLADRDLPSTVTLEGVPRRQRADRSPLEALANGQALATWLTAKGLRIGRIGALTRGASARPRSASRVASATCIRRAGAAARPIAGVAAAA